ncbi:hypothetical protein [Natronococcus sp. A-GB7]|uniref:hypothetical protein n=1 Tax=Natronococcus sp. A-GB7 TaxID=3037649 RepID=UPI00241C9424|nr:hypothetical protein [Natronococcus sp. A-GB7]MDG5821907.1 hypothetical protein [Natronococcus sp. A-GB7]
MSLHLTNAVRGGIDRATTRTGGILFGVLIVLQLLTIASFNTLLASVAPPEAMEQFGLILPISGSFAGILLLGTYLVMAVYFVVVARTFARPAHKLSSIPSELYSRRIGRATLSMIVAGIIVFVSIMIGFFLLIIPGIFLSVCFLFFLFVIGVEDRGVIASLRESWDLSRGNRLKLAVVVVFFGAIGASIGMIGAIFELIGVPVAGDLLSILVNAVLFIFIYGLLADAYLQLSGESERGSL